MKRFIPLLFTCFSSISFAQIGGNTTFALLDLSYNARSMGLANDFISVKDNDINLGIANPSLLNQKMQNGFSVSNALMAGGIHYGQVAYGKQALGGTFGGSIRFVNYGEMQRTDINGENLGTFHPFESVVTVGYGKLLNPRISVGANMHLIYSQLEVYNAFGAAIDLAGTYTNESENLLVTALFKNVGYQFDRYTKEEKAGLPAELQLAASYKLNHAPFRFSILAHNLNTWDLTYNDPSAQPTIDALTGDTIPVKQVGFGEKLARHFSYSTELLISKTIHIRVGFDYHRRQEMKLESRPGLAGFTFGTGLYFKKFSVDYGFSLFSRAGYSMMLTLSTDLSKWRK
jgi:hypothetical protein